MLGRLMMLIVLPAMLVFSSSPRVEAYEVTSVDYDDMIGVTGYKVEGSLTTEFFTSEGVSGDMTGEVYFDPAIGIYTYVLVVDPEPGNNIEFNTGFPVIGFNGTAGYSFIQARNAGAPSGEEDLVFSIESESDLTLDWNIPLMPYRMQGFWQNGAPITFFFQSTEEPGLGLYNLLSPASEAYNYAPVPLPGAGMLMGSGLFFLAALRRFRAGKTREIEHNKQEIIQRRA